MSEHENHLATEPSDELYHKECGHKRVSITNGHRFECDVVCARCNGTGDVIIEKHICDCPDCFQYDDDDAIPNPTDNMTPTTENVNEAAEGARACIVHGCRNRTDQGNFVGDLCKPCHGYLTSGKIGPTTSFLRGMITDQAAITQLKTALKDMVDGNHGATVRARTILAAGCKHDAGQSMNGVGMWVCFRCRADIPPANS